MGVKGKNPHNELVIDTFSQVEHASGLLDALLPSEIVRHLDLSTLELSQDHLVDEKLRETETDLLYRVSMKGGGEAFVYVLLEHQSTADSWMAFRLLKYIVRIWDRWHRSEQEAKKLPPIIPVVLSHAPSGWTAARDLIELIDGPSELVDALRPHLPGFEPVIEDLARRTDEELEAMSAPLTGIDPGLLGKNDPPSVGVVKG
jgi:predicted transposase/invertase (TIGR01784 family)